MKRDIYQKLLDWKSNPRRKPLLLQGARQTGKTFILKTFGRNEYENIMYCNFEEDPGLDQFFKRDLDPDRIIKELSIYYDVEIKPGADLIVFDEIQVSNRALNALKYFEEKRKDIHIAAAGSLLGVKLSSPGSFPVGKVNFLDLFPMNFMEFLDGIEEKVPVVMLQEDLDKANRLDALNLKIIRFLIALGLFMVGYDYLKRANIYGKASLPLPLPSAWINAMTPLPTVVERTGPIGLSSLAKRGDSFVYLTDNQEAAAKIPASYPRISLRRKRIDVLRADGEQGSLDDDFIFETVWFGRSSFVVDSAARSEKLLERFIELLTKRKETRAKVSQSVHLVWDLNHPMPEAQKQKLITLAKATGFSLIFCKGAD